MFSSILSVLHNLVEAKTNVEIICTVRSLQESLERDLMYLGLCSARYALAVVGVLRIFCQKRPGSQATSPLT